jgi:hypothetical protein
MILALDAIGSTQIPSLPHHHLFPRSLRQKYLVVQPYSLLGI